MPKHFSNIFLNKQLKIRNDLYIDYINKNVYQKYVMRIKIKKKEISNENRIWSTGIF